MIIHVLTAAIRAYQRAKAMLSVPCCRFYPTCSEYAVESLKQYGLFKGLSLSIWRILRCSPLSRGGFDPVRKN